MKGSVGTATHIVYIGPPTKKKYKVRGTGYFCVVCRGWIRKGQWFHYTRSGKTRHAEKSECNKA